MIAINPEKYRDDFPVLKKEINGKQIVYFDNACMSLKPRQVVEKINEYYNEYPACAGRSSHKFGSRVTEEFEKSREIISKHIGSIRKDEIVFTRNTTESINLVANSLDFTSENGRNVVLTSDREHNSNLVPWQYLREKKRILHKVIPSNPDSTFSMENFEAMLDKTVRLVSLVHTSNLDGYSLPVKEIIKIAHDNGSLVMLDAAQSMPHKEINARKLDVDFLAFSGHKMLGPTGTGVLYGKKELLDELNPFLVGGDTVKSTTYDSHEFLPVPEKFEAGLQDYSGIIGLGEAVKYLDKVGKQNIEKHEIELNRKISEALQSLSGLKILGPKEPEKRSGIVSFTIDKMNFHEIALMLDRMENIMVRSGQHCVHSWFNAHKIDGSCRASLYFYNTIEETEIFISALNRILKLR